MNPEIVTHIFGTLQSLEKSLTFVKAGMANSSGSKAEVASTLEQQEKVLNHMRRAANKLQFQVARSDWSEAVRTMKIFYGLHHMVRADIVSAKAKMSKHTPAASRTPFGDKPKHSLYH